MGSLLRFARQADKSFRFIVDTVEDTVFFIRRENSPTEKIVDVRGYGHTMPEAYTPLESCVRESVSHQRLIKYNFDSFTCVVRYEGDGYLGESSSDSRAVSTMLPDHDGISMQQGGKVIPQKAIFDIKTRSHKKKSEDILGGELDRLWVRQIPNFIMAYHQHGNFNDIEVKDVRKQILQWENDHVDELRVLSALVAEIVSYARHHPDEAFEVCSQQQGVLEMRKLDGSFPRVMPEDLKLAWGGAESDGGSDSSESQGDQAGSDAEGGVDVDSDVEGDPDYTACTEDCGYCGRCKY